MTSQREGHGLSQGAVAEQLDTEQPTISKIEHGERRVTVEFLLRWADVVGVANEEIWLELQILRARHLSAAGYWEVET